MKVATGRRWVLEHRLRMETRLGRRLKADETVHHKNRVKHDNRKPNLELWTTRHPKGQRVRDLIRFARQILKDYKGLHS